MASFKSDVAICLPSVIWFLGSVIWFLGTRYHTAWFHMDNTNTHFIIENTLNHMITEISQDCIFFRCA